MNFIIHLEITKKLLLKYLITIIKNQSSKFTNRGFSIYDSEFEYVFEFLINKVFWHRKYKRLLQHIFLLYTE